MGGRKTTRKVMQNVADEIRIHYEKPLAQAIQILADDEFFYEIWARSVLKVVECLRRVRMVDLRTEHGTALEAALRGNRFRHLKCDIALQGAIMCLVDLLHATCADV